MVYHIIRGDCDGVVVSRYSRGYLNMYNGRYCRKLHLIGFIVLLPTGIMCTPYMIESMPTKYNANVLILGQRAIHKYHIMYCIQGI